MLSVLDISASALSAERIRLNTIAQNLANANTTRNERGEAVPYRRKEVLFASARDEKGSPGVRVVDVRTDMRPLRRELDWHHPDHDAEGYVSYPNVNVMEEMVDMIMASRAYEANTTAMEVSKNMAAAALRILA